MYVTQKDPDEVQVSVSQARDDFADLVNRAAYKEERVIITRRGRAIAAIVPIEDVAYLERLEDEYDLKMVEDARAEGGEPIPWEQVEAELDLAKDR
jgi:prevent-host-death family protein